MDARSIMPDNMIFGVGGPVWKNAGVSLKSACLEAAIGVCDRARDLPLALRHSTREISMWVVL